MEQRGRRGPERWARMTGRVFALVACLAIALTSMLVTGAPVALAQSDGAVASAPAEPSGAPGTQLGGGYRGIDSADGWRLLLSPVVVSDKAGYDGVFIDEKGQSTGFVAFGNETSAEAHVIFSNGEAFFNIEIRPVGLVLRWVPIGADGQLAVESAQMFPFIRDDISLPTAPDDLANPPDEVTASFNSIAFVKSYEFWTPEQTGRAYASMTGQSRTLIKLYASVHTDILWKLCQARATPEGLAEALDGQGIDCPALLNAMADIQQRGAFGAYKGNLSPERTALLDALRCATGTLRPRDLCIEISKGTSERALSLDTAASIVARY